MNSETGWSESLQQQTREAIRSLPMTMDNRLHFKHSNGVFGYIELADLAADKLLMRYMEDDGLRLYATVDELLGDGWVVD